MSYTQIQRLIGIGTALLVFGLMGYLLFPGGFLAHFDPYLIVIGAVLLVVGLLLAWRTQRKQQEPKT